MSKKPVATMWTEPKIDWDSMSQENQDFEWVKIIHGYRVYTTGKTQKKWALDYISADKSLKEKDYKNANNKTYERIGCECRIVSGGCTSKTLVGKIEKHLAIIKLESKSNTKKMTDTLKKNKTSKEKEVLVVNKASVQDRMHENLCGYVHDINKGIDRFLEDPKLLKQEYFDMFDYMTKNNIKYSYITDIVSHIKGTLNEVKAAYNEEDEQLVEAYSYMSKTRLFKFVNLLETMITDLKKHGKRNKPKKPTRKANPESMVKKLPYKKKFDELSIQSVKPKNVVGASAVIVYNTTSRLVYVYVADNLSNGLGVKGASITGFDEKESFVKKARNPKHTTNMIIKCTKKHAIDHVDAIKTVKKPIRPRLNTNCVILKVY